MQWLHEGLWGMFQGVPPREHSRHLCGFSVFKSKGQSTICLISSNPPQPFSNADIVNVMEIVGRRNKNYRNNDNNRNPRCNTAVQPST